MKRIISVLILVCLMASFCTLSAFAAEVTVSTQAEFEGAMTTAASGDTIVLGAGDFTMVEPNATITIKYSAGTNLTFPGGEKYEDRVTYDTGSTGGSGGGGIMLLSSPGTEVNSKDSLQAAINNGGTVKLTGNIDLSGGQSITVPAGVTVTLNLNGFNITGDSSAESHFAMITNKGTLTIQGSGKISYEFKGTGDPNHGWGSYTIRNEGSLTVESGTIENITPAKSHMFCAIDSMNGSNLTINGGTIKCDNYRSVRMFTGNKLSTLTINDGNFEGRERVCQDDFCKFSKFKYLSAEKSPNISCLHIS